MVAQSSQTPTEDFKKEVKKKIDGRKTEPWGIIYSKLYQSQMPVIEKAIETAALMLGPLAAGAPTNLLRLGLGCVDEQTRRIRS